jgi:uncharacterized metal-binding protein YceD (DUF177 family)
MTVPAAEFSRLVPLARLASGGYRRQIAARPAERDALAARFGLVALDRLAADVVLRPQAGGIVLLDAAFEAAFVQSCVVTLEPVHGTISERFALRYGPPGAVEADMMPAAEEAAFEPLAGDAIDIGEAVAQELSLQLPPFPRAAEAVIEAAAETDPPAAAFAALAERRRRTPG